MKINTDGVIIGAMAYQEGAARILDVGSGTGVITLMLAQRHPEALVDAVEIDEEAYIQATYNFRQSIFADRLRSINSDFRDFHPEVSYDLIVSNPPFYTKSLHNPDPRKKLAKHADFLFFEALLDFVALHLSVHGEFHCILPIGLAEEVVALMLPKRNLYLQRIINISSYPDADPIRSLLAIGKRTGEVGYDTLIIYERRAEHTEEYKNLLKPYFLAF
ncbi:tRNA1(Val) (adenine(37)-N6)-methyltransferase [Sphingobacterium bambusae]|nr:methyltransferase [Sphingobacterium bambusae]WPL50399.1 methyltransferase [Sphingobacterium bambusae]